MVVNDYFVHRRTNRPYATPNYRPGKKLLLFNITERQMGFLKI